MKIELPQVGESVTEGIIGRWLKQVGDRVEKYDPLVEVVTDKVNMEMPSPVSGVLTSIIAEEGETVPMGAVIAEVAVEGEEKLDPGARPGAGPSGRTVAPQTIDTTGVLLKDVAPVGPTGSGGPLPSMVEQPSRQDAPEDRRHRRYSPAVIRLAQGHDVDLEKVTSTGIDGRVTRKDVQAYIDSRESVAAQPVEADGDAERVPITPVRRMIADNMVKSSSQIPQAWSTIEVDVTGLVQRRESAKDAFQRDQGIGLTYLPFMIQAVAESLRENPLLNSTWGGDVIIIKRRINIGIAVAAEEGLVVPVIKDADTLGVAELAKAVDDLAGRARRGELGLEDVQGGTFTVNNTGALGSVVSRPLVNYPQAAILATEAIVKRPVVLDDDVVIRSMMNLSLTFDHRILDGSEASAFIGDVKARLEAIGPDTGLPDSAL